MPRPRRRSALVLILALLTMATGCGGGGNGGDANGGGGAGVESAEDGQQQGGDQNSAEVGLPAYLESMAELQDRYDSVRAAASSALDSVDLEDPSTWPSAATDLTVSRDEYNELAAAVAALDVPVGLDEAHADYVKSVQLQGQVLDEFQALIEEGAAAIAEGDESAVAGIEGRADDISRVGDPIATLRSNWRTAVMAEAAKQGVTAPSWVRRVGTQR